MKTDNPPPFDLDGFTLYDKPLKHAQNITVAPRLKFHRRGKIYANRVLADQMRKLAANYHVLINPAKDMIAIHPVKDDKARPLSKAESPTLSAVRQMIEDTYGVSLKDSAFAASFDVAVSESGPRFRVSGVAKALGISVRVPEPPKVEEPKDPPKDEPKLRGFDTFTDEECSEAWLAYNAFTSTNVELAKKFGTTEDVMRQVINRGVMVTTNLPPKTGPKEPKSEPPAKSFSDFTDAECITIFQRSKTEAAVDIAKSLGCPYDTVLLLIGHGQNLSLSGTVKPTPALCLDSFDAPRHIQVIQMVSEGKDAQFIAETFAGLTIQEAEHLELWAKPYIAYAATLKRHDQKPYFGELLGELKKIGGKK